MPKVQPLASETPDPRDQRDPVEAFQALAAEYHLQVEEWDTSTLEEKLRDNFFAFYLELKDGTRILVVPLGQDPSQRLQLVHALLARQGVTA